MKSIATSLAFFLALLATACASTAQSQASGRAEALFNDYSSLERSYDPTVADLYCDSALIRNVRTFPDGQKRTLELPATKYKELIRIAMPLAKAKSDYSTYSGVAYASEGNNVRITATRYSNMKKYSSPMSLLVGACNGGAWAILEELSESIP